MGVKTYPVLGVMAGSSADGVDIAFCLFKKNEKWDFQLLACETFPYDDEEVELLKKLPTLSGKELIAADRFFSKIYAQKILTFITKYNVKPLLIGLHGHTVFHNPAKGYTYQLGHGGIIATLTNIPVVSDFRSQDIALGGEGAPLVPLGDEIFFEKYDAVLNIGGIANISFKKEGKRLGYDIVPANQLLNYEAQMLNLSYDDKGMIARKGNIIQSLYEQLIEAQAKIPLHKSLAREDVEKHYLPIIHKFKEHPVPDLLNTTSAFIADVISKHLEQFKNVFITGGGAHNAFLLELIQKKLPSLEITVPDKDIIDFKEAMIFAFLALRRFLNEETTLHTVTRASRNSITGALWLP
jgi:anhydro-N-acetylmuramic acid kinase